MDRIVVGGGLWMVAIVLGGCDDSSAIRPSDVRRYVAPAPPAGLATARPDEAAAANPIRYEVPDGWTEGEAAGGMRLATLFVGDPKARREVTVIPASGSLRGNVERWQAQLDAQAAADAIQAAVDRALAGAEQVEVDGVSGTIVLLEGPAAEQGQEAILGGIVPLDETRSLFVKFRGDLETARAQRDAFRRFVQSLRWK